MNGRRSLALGRLTFVSAIAIAMALAPPAMPRLFAGLARTHDARLMDSVGWLGAYGIANVYYGPFRYGGLVFASSVIAAIAFLAVEARARRRVDGVWSFVAVLLAATCCLDALRVGGGMIDAAFAAVTVLLLESASMRARLASIAITAIWCNVDATGSIAPLLAVVSAVATTFEPAVTLDARATTMGARRGVHAERVCGAWIVAVSMLGATLATPLGAAFFAHAFASMQLAGASTAYAAWTPSDLAPHAFRFGALAIVFLALAVGMRGVAVRDGLLATTAFLLALANGAFVPLFGIVTAPIVVGGLARRVGLPSFGIRHDPLASVASIVVLVAIASGVLAGAKAIPISADEPYAVIDRLARIGLAHRAFCANLTWCDAVETVGLHVLADGRIAEGSQATRDAQIEISNVRAWRKTMHSFAVDVALVGADSALATILTASKWTVLARTTTFVILVAKHDRP